MSFNDKYGRTYHYPFSPGTTSDDRINHDYWNDVQKIYMMAHTEKLDGENTCLNGVGIFSRSHAAPTLHPWADHLKAKFSLMQKDLDVNNIEIFGENLYAVHSIRYDKLNHYFYVFGVRCLDKWLSWEEVKFHADFYEFPVVPLLDIVISPEKHGEEDYRRVVTNLVNEPSVFGSFDSVTDMRCNREGIVSRNMDEYSVADFKHNVFKWVRKGHVNTDEHWSRNWKRAKLCYERKETDKTEI